MDLYKAKYSKKKSRNNFTSNRNRFDKNFKDKPANSFRNFHSHEFNKNRDMHNVICSECGVKCQIPFEPKFNKPVYCSSCYEKKEPRKLKKSQYIEKSPRKIHSKEKRNFSSFVNENKSIKSKSKKFLKKQASFYSNGSEKFYASIKEKLFEILGGKVCSSCGFKDARALGFHHIYDNDAFDRIRRGGFASSWGKYISDPDLAKKELKVLCLNCNEIREPLHKDEKDNPKPTKKSRYFPR